MQRQSTKILLIEDDQDDFRLIRDLFSEIDRGHYHLDWARNYQEGLKQIQAGLHDIYMIDYRLGADDGLQLLAEAVKAGSQAPIIMITGLADQEIDVAAMQAGATDYLVKSQVNGQLLERSIRYALEHSRLLKKIQELAIHDVLTGLYNRRELYRFLENELTKCQRYGHPLSLLMMDIDHFKDINDRFGHRTGDEILQHIAQVLLSNARACDLLVRYGGDEFIVVMLETSASQALQGAERLRKVVETESVKVKRENDIIENIKVTVSLGVATFPGDANSSDALIEAADQALYQAKLKGRNCVACFHAGQAQGGYKNDQ